MDSDEIRDIVEDILNQRLKLSGFENYNPLFEMEIGVSARHLHISREHLNILFGDDYQLTPVKDLKQPGQYAAEETVKFTTPDGVIEELRILGPVREETQVELSLTDAFNLGLEIHLPIGTYKDGVGGAEISGPSGSVELKSGIMLAQRHLHTSIETAEKYGLEDGELISAEIPGERGGILHNFLVRVSEDFADELHLDTDEANALMVRTGDLATILKVRINDRDTSPPKEPFTGKKDEPSLSSGDTGHKEELEYKEKLLSERDIKSISKKGVKKIVVSRGVVVTSLARDLANTLRIEIIYPEITV